MARDIATAYKRLGAELAQLRLLSNEGAIDYGRDVVSQGRGGHGKHGVTSAAPTGYDPTAEWAGRVDRLAQAVAAERRAAQRGRLSIEGGRKARERRIQLDYRGLHTRLVAFIEDCSERTVQRAREKRELDEHGYPPERPRPLTSRELPTEGDTE